MTEPNGDRFCDRCGVPLTEENNKCGYEIVVMIIWKIT